MSTKPYKEVKAYPKLKSKHPLYGKVAFDIDLSNRKGIEFHFVLDESGEDLPRDEKKEEKTAREDSRGRSQAHWHGGQRPETSASPPAKDRQNCRGTTGCTSTSTAIST